MHNHWSFAGLRMNESSFLVIVFEIDDSQLMTIVPKQENDKEGMISKTVPTFISWNNSSLVIRLILPAVIAAFYVRLMLTTRTTFQEKEWRTNLCVRLSFCEPEEMPILFSLLHKVIRNVGRKSFATATSNRQIWWVGPNKPNNGECAPTTTLWLCNDKEKLASQQGHGWCNWELLRNVGQGLGGCTPAHAYWYEHFYSTSNITNAFSNSEPFPWTTQVSMKHPRQDLATVTSRAVTLKAPRRGLSS